MEQSSEELDSLGCYPQTIDCPFCTGKMRCIKPGSQYHCDTCDWWLVWHPEPELKIEAC